MARSSGWVFQGFGRDSAQAPQFGQKLLLRRVRRRRVMAAELRRPRSRGYQQPGLRKSALSQQARQLEGHRRAHAVAEECEGTLQVALYGGSQRFHQGAHAFKGRLRRARFAARQADGTHRHPRQPPSSEGRRAAAGIGKTKQPRGFGCGGLPHFGKPGRGGRPFAQQQGQKPPLIGRQSVRRVQRGAGTRACRVGTRAALGCGIPPPRTRVETARAAPACRTIPPNQSSNGPTLNPSA